MDEVFEAVSRLEKFINTYPHAKELIKSFKSVTRKLEMISTNRIFGPDITFKGVMRLTTEVTNGHKNGFYVPSSRAIALAMRFEFKNGVSFDQIMKAVKNDYN